MALCRSLSSLVVMKKENGKATAAQGAEVAKEKGEITLVTIKKWLKHDLSAAVSCLNAIQTDPDLLDSVAMFMFGRFQNDMNKKKAEQDQMNIFDPLKK